MQAAAASSSGLGETGVGSTATCGSAFTSKPVPQHGEQSKRCYGVGPLCRSIFDAGSTRRRVEKKVSTSSGEVLAVCKRCYAELSGIECKDPSGRHAEPKLVEVGQGFCRGHLCEEAFRSGGKRNRAQTNKKFQSLCKRCFYYEQGKTSKKPSGKSALVKALIRRMRMKRSPQECYGRLCNEAAMSGGSRNKRQKEARFKGLCKTCFADTHGSKAKKPSGSSSTVIIVRRRIRKKMNPDLCDGVLCRQAERDGDARNHKQSKAEFLNYCRRCFRYHHPEDAEAMSTQRKATREALNRESIPPQ